MKRILITGASGLLSLNLSIYAKDKYEIIMFDSSRIFALSDPVIMAKTIDNILVITSVGKSMIHLINSVESIQEINKNILGCVLNKMGTGLRRKYYYYYYGS